MPIPESVTPEQIRAALDALGLEEFGFNLVNPALLSVRIDSNGLMVRTGDFYPVRSTTDHFIHVTRND